MNYHIITQDKFFDGYIEDIYHLHEESNNVFWVRGNKGDKPYLQTIHPVEYLGDDAATYLEKLSIIKSTDKLFVSWYDTFIGELIIASKITCPLYVYVMGAEFYSMPNWWHTDWLLDPMTKRKVKQTRLYPRFFLPHRPWRWYRYVTDYMYYRRFMHSVEREYWRKVETVKRIDYLVISEHSDKEVDFIRSLYPGCHAQHAIGHFDQNVDLAAVQPLKPIPSEGKPIQILFGNSCDPNGNQLDAIHYIKHKLRTNYLVNCFLSYGDEEARKWIMEYAERQLGNRFHPILNYMNREAFVHYVQQMDVIMMFHNRQQAEGNIMTALVLGKPVFMKTKNPQYEMLHRMGIKAVYDVEQMHKIDLREAISNAQEHRIETIDIIARENSDAVRLTHLKTLLNA